MKIDYISDLHLDFWISKFNPANSNTLGQIESYIEMIGLKGGEVLLIAGDLGHYFGQDALFLEMVKEMYEHVMIVPGNHDMYLVSSSKQKKYKWNSMNRILEMKEWCKKIGVDYLDGQTVEINGIKFAGCGMSWDKSFYERVEQRLVEDMEVHQFYNNIMNDSRLIFSGNETKQTTHRGTTKFNPFKFFEQEMEKLRGIESADVMLSHYPPIIPYQAGNRYARDPISTFFMFYGDPEVERIKPKVWVFGHMHSHYDLEKLGTRFLCNPLGYPGENTYTQVKSFEL